ncbi:MAG: DUF2089 domain-containing protein [Anaerolineales bacterium]|nr:DUF2089 domain-containing protein [Anaerolineales bacterium]
MHPILGTCPVCGETLAVTRLHCRNCDTTIEGRFAVGAFDRLSPEQLAFAETFIRCEGKLNRMEKELNLSYPTLRARLNDLIRSMGYEVGQEESGTAEDERRRILDDLAAGRLTSEAAVKALQGNA